jgi:hypothetical protein
MACQAKTQLRSSISRVKGVSRQPLTSALGDEWQLLCDFTGRLRVQTLQAVPVVVWGWRAGALLLLLLLLGSVVVVGGATSRPGVGVGGGAWGWCGGVVGPWRVAGPCGGGVGQGVLRGGGGGGAIGAHHSNAAAGGGAPPGGLGVRDRGEGRAGQVV